MGDHLEYSQSIELLEHHDGMARLRNGLRKMAEETEDWAGIPMPLEGVRLVVEPTYRYADRMKAAGMAYDPTAPVENDIEGAKVRNVFYSHHWRSQIIVWEKDGKIDWGKIPAVHHLLYDMNTLGASDVWGIEQESNAIGTLCGLVQHRQFKQYMLTGMFMERSKRSDVTYMFRRLKPTVAIRSDDDGSRILCCLCMHPIAYYESSWAGAMCPTDDIIAHLMLMRGDEHMFWKRSNQHPAYLPEAGL